MQDRRDVTYILIIDIGAALVIRFNVNNSLASELPVRLIDTTSGLIVAEATCSFRADAGVGANSVST